ncbi:hypothetical protein GQ43DRAFT_439473 [Delitschia confertaspora ATCC 74209]|uniref:Uncharacterized protein n=1 Tax=Delitschia confertaspora ATCC 74209 TaxID=1513339 RepID=A0A9P4JQW3_9PLEO|nr:hypothetical protein GQ43DRAFT_439473 [Delitschia confertaspora ATCC 74209]
MKPTSFFTLLMGLSPVVAAPWLSPDGERTAPTELEKQQAERNLALSKQFTPNFSTSYLSFTQDVLAATRPTPTTISRTITTTTTAFAAAYTTFVQKLKHSDDSTLNHNFKPDTSGITPWNDSGRSQMMDEVGWTVCPRELLRCTWCPNDPRCKGLAASSKVSHGSHSPHSAALHKPTPVPSRAKRLMPLFVAPPTQPGPKEQTAASGRKSNSVEWKGHHLDTTEVSELKMFFRIYRTPEDALKWFSMAHPEFHPPGGDSWLDYALERMRQYQASQGEKESQYFLGEESEKKQMMNIGGSNKRDSTVFPTRRQYGPKDIKPYFEKYSNDKDAVIHFIHDHLELPWAESETPWLEALEEMKKEQKKIDEVNNNKTGKDLSNKGGEATNLTPRSFEEMQAEKNVRSGSRRPRENRRR